MTATLYLSDTSPFGTRVRLVAAFTGSPLTEAPPPGGAGSDSMKAISVFGKMPAISLDDRVLIESLALMEYLVDLAGGSPLVPSDPADRAAMRGIMLAHDNHVLGAVWPMFLQLRTGTPDPAICTPAMQAAAAQYAQLSRLFEGPEGFALGGRITLADLAIAPFALLFGRIYPMFGQETPFAGNTRIGRWWQTVSAVPEVERVLAVMDAAFVRAFVRK